MSRRRQRWEDRRLERLEDRRVMAFDLVAAYAESETPFFVKDVSPAVVSLQQAPQQITLRFTPGTQVDPNTLPPTTLGGISVVRAGGDGDFTQSVAVPLGVVLVDDFPNRNQVVIRFAETLPDDTYRISVGAALGSVNAGSANAAQVDVRLNLGAFVEAVVPQPVVRGQVVTFSNLPADGDTLAVSIRGVQNVFEFDSNNLVTAGRIRVSLAGATPTTLATAVRDAINTATFSVDGGVTSERAGASAAGNRVTVTGTSFTPVLTYTRLLGVGSSPVSFGDGGLEQRADRVVVHFNDDDPLDRTSAQTAANYRLLETDPATGKGVGLPIVPSGVSYDAASATAVLVFTPGVVLADKLYRLQIGGATTGPDVMAAAGSDENSSFASATPLGGLALGTITVDGTIDLRATVTTPLGTLGFPGQPGSIDEPGHRDTPADSGDHGEATLVTQPANWITSQAYNFRANIGFDPQGNVLTNQITEEQKQRAREVFEIFSRYSGVRFIETAADGITVATGDMRAVSPTIPTSPAGVAGGLLAVMDSTENWGVSEYGGFWFQVAMHEIAHVLGLEHSYDLPSIMGRALPGEAIFPGDYDLVHLRQLYPANGSDIDVYSFSLSEAGRLSMETVVGRPGEPATSPLDTVLTLYREENVNGRLVRTMVARNDDSYGRDSFVGIDLAPGSYYVAVTSAGNTNFNPEVVDSGYGGRSDGDYRLRLGFVPASLVATTVVDVTGTPLDGDRDGAAGGTFDFWFQTASQTANPATNLTIFVDKVGATRSAVTTQNSTNVTMQSTVGLVAGMVVKGAGIAAGTRIQAVSGVGITLTRAATASSGTASLAFCDGTLAFPFTEIDDALAAVDVILAAVPATTRVVMRILGNSSQTPYLLGTTLSGQQVLADGATFNVPQRVTVMVDEGAVFKLRATVIDVGSSQPGSVSRAEAAFQVLGVPGNNVHFTSYHDDAVGGDSDGVGPTVAAGQWGGIILRQDSDIASKKVFLNAIGQATFKYGGGEVRVDSQLEAIAPIQLEGTRPSITFNTITASAGAALAATPNSFEDTGDRIGPEIRGNSITGNSINGLFVKIKTNNGQPLDKLDVPARFKSTDIVYVIQENLVIAGGAGGYTGTVLAPVARRSGRLTIDPGVVVKVASSRIELERGTSQLIAEGMPGQRVTFTSLADNRFGAGGTFDTNGSLPDVTAAGDWGGIMLNVGAKASIDHAYLAFGGGSTPIEGGFDRFNVIEVHQADLRLANSRLENNAVGTASGTRTGRGDNAAATVFVRGAQPIIVGNDFRSNAGAAVSINANSLTDALNGDPGRVSGPLGRFTAYDDNVGPLVRGNRMSYSAGAGAVAGMVVRGEEITIESVWDDTDIVHVVQSEIIVANFHTATGLRLQSKPASSLVVKLQGANAGFTASGAPLDIDDRIGGTVQIVGQPGYPVILTSLRDDSVGAGLDPLGRLVTDTNTDGTASTPQPGDWRSLKFLEYSNDRNVAVLLEREQATTGGIDTNNIVAAAQQLGILAPNVATTVGGLTNSVEAAQEKSGNEDRRLGFEVHGFIAADSPTDVDVYGFSATAGSTVWIDVDKTSPGLDSMVELLDASGTVLARSADSGLEGTASVGERSLSNSPSGTSLDFAFQNTNIVPASITGTIYAQITYVDENNRLRVGRFPTQKFFVDADGDLTFENLRGSPLQPLTVVGTLGTAVYPFVAATTASTYDLDSGLLTMEFETAVDPGFPGSLIDGYWIQDIEYLYSPGALDSGTGGAAAMLPRDAWNGGDFYSTNPKDPGMRVVLPGMAGQSTQYFIRVRSQPGYSAGTTAADYQAGLRADPVDTPNGASSGGYELRVRLRQRDEKPGSTVTYADIRFPTVGIDVQGLPRNSLLVGESGERPTDDNGSLAAAQPLGNLLQSDRATIGVAGTTANAADVDWYTFTLNFEQVQAIGGLNDQMPSLPVVFDIDYADGFRGDLTISVFDDKGKLIYIGRDSNVADDQAAAGQGNDFDDLSRGSAGRLDPFLGPVPLAVGAPAGGGFVEGGGIEPPDPNRVKRYYVAISSNQQLPSQLDGFFRGSAANAAVRLEPISGIDRPVDGGIGSGYKSIVVVDTRNVPALANHVTPFTLADVPLFVANAGSVLTVDASRGGTETTLTTTAYPATTPIGEIGMRSDGRLYGYVGVTGDPTTAGRFGVIDPGTGTFTPIGNDNIADPVTATQNDLAPLEVTTPVTRTTFQLAQQNLVRGGVSGTIRLQVVDAGPPVVTRTSTWNFTSNAAGAITFTPQGVDGALPGPVAGTSVANFATGRLTIDWDGNINPATLRMTAVTYSSPEGSLATDEVDAFAWRRQAAGQYDRLYFAVRDPASGRSALFSANPATASTTPVQNQDWGLKGRITAGATNIGYTTGMAYVGATLYGVGSNGHLFTINATTGAATVVATVAGAPNFTSLTIGPQNLAGAANGGVPVAGYFADKLFATATNGRLYCMDTSGTLLQVFDSNGNGSGDATSIASGVTAPTGLAFSPLDVNLWHPTTRNGASMYFGFEQYQATNPTYGGFSGVNGQYGVVSSTWQQDLSTNADLINSYNMPGGAYGSVTTNGFSLAGYSYNDKPTLYLDYWLETQDAESGADGMRDSARVLVSTDGGVNWERAVASNNAARGGNQDLPSFVSTSSAMSSAANQLAQELYDTANWRQLRVDLGQYVGSTDIRLRFDFSTAGMFDATARSADGTLLNQIGSVANSRGNFTSAERGQQNAYEGFYIRNLVVGFAERGEQVVGAAENAAGFFDSVAVGGAPPGSQVLQGPYQLEIRRGPNSMPAALDTNRGFVASRRRLGDQNQPREQGQFIISNNVIRGSSGYGISIDSGVRDASTGMPHPGVPRNLQLVNNSRLVSGVVVANNVISGTGALGAEGSGNGILFSGDSNSGNVPRAAVPFGRIVNNTFYGGVSPKGVGVTVTENAAPTLMNNVFANLATGVSVDGSSAGTVVAVSGFANTATQVTGVTQDRAVSLGNTTSPFVNAPGGNFYLRAGSPAIDSALNTLQDRFDFRVVNSTIDVPESPIIAPSLDLFGQLRQDDPTQAPSLPGLGSNAFKDLGAVERADAARPFATLVVPLDQGGGDSDPALDSVILLSATTFQTSFDLQLSDSGVGIDPSSVVSAAFSLTRNGLPLTEGVDYAFRYLQSSNRVVFEAASVFSIGRYVIRVNQQTVGGSTVNMISDLAGNPLLANKSDGTTSFTIAVIDLPSAPGKPVGTPGDMQVLLNWPAPASDGGQQIDDYEIQYKENGQPDTSYGTFADGTSAAVTATVTPLTNGTAYVFRVRARNLVGNSAWSPASDPVTPGIVPSEPLNLVLVGVASSRVQLGWNAPTTLGSPALNDYIVEVKPQGQPDSAYRVFADAVTNSPGAAVTTYNGSPLIDGSAYTFRVKARNLVGDGPYAVLATNPVPGVVPGAPTGLAGNADAANRTVTLVWAEPLNAGSPRLTDYIVEVKRSGQPDSSYTVSPDAVQATTGATVTGMLPGVSYVFRVKAVNLLGDGAWSLSATVAVPTTLPTAPTNLSVLGIGSGTVSLAWQPPTDDGGAAISGYLVQYKVTGQPDSAYLNFGIATSLAANVTGLTNGVSYTFRVAAINVNGAGPAAVSTAVTPWAQAAAPTRLAATSGDGFVTLAWTAPRLVAGQQILDYQIQYRAYTNGVASPTWTTVSDGVSNLARATFGMPNGGTYDFRVSAITTGGVIGVFSAASIRVTPFSRTAVPTPPTGVVVTRSSATSASLSFTPPPANAGGPVTGYVIQYRLPTSRTWITFNYAGGSPATISRLLSGRSYVFRIAARNLAGIGTFSSELTMPGT